MPERLAPADLRALIRDVPDFPRPGIVFKDITPVLLDPAALDHAIEVLAEDARARGVEVVVAAEARGFILGGALAARAGAGFIPARKPGKLPATTDSVSYELEYGVDELEMHAGAVAADTRVLVHDDLLATGGTAEAKCRLVEQAGGEVVGCSFLVELSFLGGRERLAPRDVFSVIQYEGE